MDKVRVASDIDYEATYTNYYGHDKYVSSFHKNLASIIISKNAELDCSSYPVLDIGGGSGLLSSIFIELGIKSTFIDVNPKSDGIKLNLAEDNSEELASVKNIIENRLTSTNWFSTCLDVFEHISLRDMHSFLKNIYNLISNNLLISISTRPSADGNRYHPTVLPIETWMKLLDAAGLVCVDDNYINWKGNTNFSGIDDKISTVSYWCKRNIFNDDKGHQHYLLLKKGSVDQKKLTQLINGLIMPRALDEARSHLNIVYTVNFIQDWHFLRELMDFVRGSELTVIFTRNNIPPVNLAIIKNIVLRCGVISYFLEDVLTDVESFVASFKSKALLISATEGPISRRHLATLPLVEAAEKAGHVTTCFQHGMILPDRVALQSNVFLAWSDLYAAEMKKRYCSGLIRNVYNSGLIRPSSSYIKSHFDYITLRFGDRFRRYIKKIVVSSNLHWRSAHLLTPTEFVTWLKNEATLNEDILFIWRPHPDEYAVYQSDSYPDNVLILEQVITDILDISICEIIKNADACITTLSTIAFDSTRLGTPVAIFPFNSDVGKDILLTPEVVDNAFFISDVSSFDLRDFVFSASPTKKNHNQDESNFFSLLHSLYISDATTSNHEQLSILKRHYDSSPPISSMPIVEWHEKYCCGKIS